MNKEQLQRIEEKLDQILTLLQEGNVNLNVKKTKESQLDQNKKDTSSLKSEKNIEEIKKIYAHYKVKINNRSRLITKAENKIKARLKEYSIDQLLQAIDNFSADDWWMKNNSRRGIAWFFHSEDRIEQFINLIPQKQPVKLDLFHNGQPCKIIDRRLKVYAPWSGNWLDWNKNHPQFETFVLKANGNVLKKGKDAYDHFVKEFEL